MKLGTKIAAVISLVFAVVLGTAAVVLTLDEIEFLEQEMDFHGRMLGHVVASAAEPTLKQHTEREARIREITEREERLGIRWIDLAAGLDDDTTAPLPRSLWAKLRRGEVVGRVSPQDEDTLYTYVPLSSSDGSLRVIEIAESLEARDAHVHSLLVRVIGGSTIGLLLSGGLALIVGRRLVGRPVDELIEVARHVGSGDFSRRADESRSDELGVLAREMNAMATNLARARERAEEQEATRRQMEAQLQHADRLATLGQLASGVAHEIGTPLQSIVVRADLIGERAGHVEGVPDLVQGIKRQSGRVATIGRNLLRFARKQSPRRTPRDLQEIVASALALVEAARKKGPIEISSEIAAEQRMATVDQEQIEQVLTNLILNAIQAMPDGGRITVGVEPGRAPPPPDVESAAEAYLCLYVEDEGEGIPEDVLPHIFDPFYTTKPAGEGTGLGLSISYGIVREHGGWIAVEGARPRGTRFSVYLPAA